MPLYLILTVLGSLSLSLSPPPRKPAPPVCLLSFSQRRATVSLGLLSRPNHEAGASNPQEDPRESLGPPDLPMIWGCETLRAD